MKESTAEHNAVYSLAWPDSLPLPKFYLSAFFFSSFILIIHFDCSRFSYAHTYTYTKSIKVDNEIHHRNELNQNVIIKRSFYKDGLQRNSSTASSPTSESAT